MELTQQVLRHFQPLFREHGFSIVGERYFQEQFGNEELDVESSTLRLLFIQDRGFITPLIGPRGSSPDNMFALEDVLRFLNVPLPDEKDIVQLELARPLAANFPAVSRLFSDDFSSHVSALKDFQASAFKKRFSIPDSSQQPATEQDEQDFDRIRAHGLPIPKNEMPSPRQATRIPFRLILMAAVMGVLVTAFYLASQK